MCTTRSPDRQSRRVEPGTVAARHHGAVLVRTGDGALWIGQVRLAGDERGRSIKLPASMALADYLGGVPELITPPNGGAGFREVTYERFGSVGSGFVRLL